jgi:hypothetical protein
LKLALLVLAILILCAACQGSSRSAQATRIERPVAARPAHYGGDSRAWLRPGGDGADSSLCHATLKLPLSLEPAWSFDYDAAEFSSYDVLTILHYDGQLVLQSRTPQIRVLDVTDGHVLCARDIATRRIQSDSIETIFQIQVTPNGHCLLRDSEMTLHLMDLLDPEYHISWSRKLPSKDLAGLISGTGTVHSCVLAKIDSYSLLDGSLANTWPVTAFNGRLARSRESELVWWKFGHSEMTCLGEGEPGARWGVMNDVPFESVMLDDSAQAVYAVLSDESIDCRSLADGSRRWNYEYAWMFPEQERQEISERYNGIKVPFEFSAMSVLEDGIAAAMTTGDVFRLSSDGTLVWHVKLDTGVNTLLAFDNALMVQQFFAKVGRQPQRTWELYVDKEPDWKLYQKYGAGSAGPAPGPRLNGPDQRILFSKLVVLDLNDGRELDAMEEEVFSTAGMTPARDKVVLGGSPPLSSMLDESGTAARRKVLAYNWLEPEG